jgi:CRISPR type IV-associated protein Csf3
VEELLSEISYLGKLTRNGFGKVKSVTVTQDDRAADRWSLRVLPREHKERSKDVEYVDVASPTSPPYWDKLKRVAAVKPMFLPGDTRALRA